MNKDAPYYFEFPGSMTFLVGGEKYISLPMVKRDGDGVLIDVSMAPDVNVLLGLTDLEVNIAVPMTPADAKVLASLLPEDMREQPAPDTPEAWLTLCWEGTASSIALKMLDDKRHAYVALKGEGECCLKCEQRDVFIAVPEDKMGTWLEWRQSASLKAHNLIHG